MRAARGLRPALMVPLLLLQLCSACATVRPMLPGGAARPTPPPSLQVPFVAQSVLLCGGAAVAMLERWWGRLGVFAEAFAHLVRPEEGGIRTTDLTQAIQSRGWATEDVSGDVRSVQRALLDSVPVLALLRMGRDRYHYVVIVGWHADRVTYHDPAGTPFTSVDTTAFLERWRGANRWALVVRPGVPVPPASPAVIAATPDSLPCRPWLDLAADAAIAGDLASADRHLANASAACPTESLVLRERAGVRFRQRRFTDATHLAAAYTRRAPADSLGWQLLATSRYLDGDAAHALDAWNRVGRPAVDLVRIDGLVRTPFRDVLRMAGVVPGQTLTSVRYALAQRRLADAPTLGATRVDYAPVPDGAVELRVTANERQLIDALPQLALVTTIDAVFRRDVHLSLASPLRLGELWTAQWRWQPSDPRVAVRVAIPARIGIPMVAHIERSWARYRFAGPVTAERQEAATLHLTSWLRPSLEALAGLRYETWSARGDFIAMHAGAGYHALGDRIALLVEGDHATPRGAGTRYQQLRTRAMFAPSPTRWDTRWTMRLGLDLASAETPIGVQPLAGGDLARAIPLRAHPFILDRRVLPSARIARTILHGGAAGDRPITVRGPIRLAGGVFLDAAHVGPNAAGASASQLYVDAGAGVQIGLTGTRWAALRLDVARGLTVDRRWGFAAGLAPSWPPRLGRAR